MLLLSFPRCAVHLLACHNELLHFNYMFCARSRTEHMFSFWHIRHVTCAQLIGRPGVNSVNESMEAQFLVPDRIRIS